VLPSPPPLLLLLLLLLLPGYLRLSTDVCDIKVGSMPQQDLSLALPT
jgi:hypothetical protein